MQKHGNLIYFICIPSAIELYHNCYLVKVIKLTIYWTAVSALLHLAGTQNQMPPQGSQFILDKYSLPVTMFSQRCFQHFSLMYTTCIIKKIFTREPNTKCKITQSPQAKKENKINLSKEDGQLKHRKIQHFIKQSTQLHNR